MRAKRLDLRGERFQRFLSPLLRGQFERWITSVVRQREHFSKQRCVLRRRKALRQQCIELVELCLRGVVVREPSSPLHLADDRIEGAVGVLRRAEVAQARVWLVSEAFQQRSRQSRLADARFTGEQHHLAFAGLRLRPAPQQQFEFFFAPDKFSQCRSRAERRSGSRLKTVAAPPRLAPALRCP